MNTALLPMNNNNILENSTWCFLMMDDGAKKGDTSVVTDHTQHLSDLVVVVVSLCKLVQLHSISIDALSLVFAKLSHTFLCSIQDILGGRHEMLSKFDAI